MSDTIDNDAQELAEFDAGFTGVDVPKDAPKPEAQELAETPRVETPKPEYVRVTAKDWAEVRAAAARTASYDQQFSKAFGTIGNLQKIVNGFKDQGQAAQVSASKAEALKAAFAGMEKDFPELAQANRTAMEAVLAGFSGGANDADPAKIEALLAEVTTKREIEVLEDAHPDWRSIVGVVTKDETPDPENPFRKWLGTKANAYQARVNASDSAAVISRAIGLFQAETTAAKPAEKPRDEARAERIKQAVQPRGDGSAAPAGKTDEDEFLAGFNSR